MTVARALKGVAAAVLLTLAGQAAHAQALGGGDEPIDITANELELVDAQRVQIWRGAVEAVQGPNRLRTSLLQVYHAPKAGAPAQPAPGGAARMGDWGEAQRMVAEGEVYFVTPETVSTGRRADYDLLKDVITITGDVIVRRGESVLRGDRLVIDVATGRSSMQANAQGRGSPRVRGVFYPEDRAAQPAAAPRPGAG
jgi:lipopolysaccharide export system protein LptA